MNNRGQSVGFSWIYGILIIGLVGLMFVIFNQVYNDNILGQTNYLLANVSLLNASGQQEAYDQITKYGYFWSSIPIIVFLSVILWMILNASRKTSGE